MKSRTLEIQENGFELSAGVKTASRRKLRDLLADGWREEYFDNMANKADGLCWALLIISAMYLLPVCIRILSR
jgi:hypothetical protein